MKTRVLCSLALCGVIGLAACGDDTSGDGDNGDNGGSGSSNLSGQIAGAGASSQQAAQEAWKAGFQSANEGVTVTYDPVGSGGGREQFIAGGKILFGGTDSLFEDEELSGAEDRCGGKDNFIEAPIYVSPIAVVYTLEGVDSLQLSPKVMANIFNGKIKNWNDGAIAKENPDAKLPSTRISVTHRSDDSGTTENFTDYLSKASGGAWSEEVSDTWPIKGQEAADGTSGVVSAVKQGNGSIGYADLSQAQDLGKVNVIVDGEPVEPTAESAAKIFDESKQTEGTGKNVFTYELNREPGAGVYPIVLVSYVMACTQYDNKADADNTKGYLKYMASDDGQKAAADNAGSAPLPESVSSKLETSFDSIGSGS